MKGRALRPDRLFDSSWRPVARELYESVRDLPLVCPHGHVDPSLLADPGATLGTPAELFIIPDHYVYRMLYSQGIAMEDLGASRPSTARRWRPTTARSGSFSARTFTSSAVPRLVFGSPTSWLTCSA